MDTTHVQGAQRTAVRIPGEGGQDIEAELARPTGAGGAVVLCSVPGKEAGGGMEDVAAALHAVGVATLRADAVPHGTKAAGRGDRFYLQTMTERLKALLDWLVRDPRTRGLPLGCVAAGTAGAAAMRLAAERKGVRAVAVLEGRPDLAVAALERVKAPTLLVVAGLDAPLLRLNRRAMRRLRAPVLLEVIPGALHGLREPGGRAMMLARVADWFGTHLGTREPARGGTGMGSAEHPLSLTP